MYESLLDLSKRPEPFSRYTAKELWTRPHLARQMLNYHLSQDTDLASRRIETIDRVVDWIADQIKLPGKKLCDLGCGPGMYTERFASRGARVTGVDFSHHSLKYARTEGSGSVRYREADYLSDELPIGFDVITLIYTDLCVLSATQRSRLLGRMHNMLNLGGAIVLDVAGIHSFSQKQETTVIEHNMMGGFWAPGDYVGIQRTYLYPEHDVSLDRYLIVEPAESWQVYNWFQHFTPNRIQNELRQAGFRVEKMTGDLAGAALTPESELIGIIARPV